MVLVVPSRSSELVASVAQMANADIPNVGLCQLVLVTVSLFCVARLDGANCFDLLEQERKIAGDR